MNEDFIRRYASETANLLRTLDPGPILAAVSALYVAQRANNVVLLCGNGGSGSSCSHIVNDLQKDAGVRAICLNDAAPLVSAWANDSAWKDVFRPQVGIHGHAGGVLIAVSGSGNSENVMEAVRSADNMGMGTIGLTGYDGGRLKDDCDISIHVPTDSMQHAEDVHMVILHMLYLGLQQRIKEG